MLYKKLHLLSPQNILSQNITVIFVDLLLAKTNPICVGIFYRPPEETNFLKLFAEILNSLSIFENEIFALGDMNINILQNGVNLLEEKVNPSKGKNVMSSYVKNYIEFCLSLRLR